MNLLLQMALSEPSQILPERTVTKVKNTKKLTKNAANLCKKDFFFHVLFKLSYWQKRECVQKDSHSFKRASVRYWSKIKRRKTADCSEKLLWVKGKVLRMRYENETQRNHK